MAQHQTADKPLFEALVAQSTDASICHSAPVI